MPVVLLGVLGGMVLRYGPWVPVSGDLCKTFVAPAKAGIQGERTSSGSWGCNLSPPHPNPLPRGERGFLIQALKGEGVMQRSPSAGIAHGLVKAT